MNDAYGAAPFVTMLEAQGKVPAPPIAKAEEPPAWAMEQAREVVLKLDRETRDECYATVIAEALVRAVNRAALAKAGDQFNNCAHYAGMTEPIAGGTPAWVINAWESLRVAMRRGLWTSEQQSLVDALDGKVAVRLIHAAWLASPEARRIERIVEAARLRRNTRLSGATSHWVGLSGEWTAVPAEDFEKLAAALAESAERGEEKAEHRCTVPMSECACADRGGRG